MDALNPLIKPPVGQALAPAAPVGALVELRYAPTNKLIEPKAEAKEQGKEEQGAAAPK